MLKYLNAILLNELTMNYSDMDKSKYLNVMLLNEFKNNIQRKDNLKMTQNEDFEECKESNDDQLLNKETTKQVATIQTPIEIDFKDNLVSCKEEMNEFNSSENNVKIFLCDICNKEYSIYFHLKQHIRKVHEATRSFHLNSIQNDQILEEHEIANNGNDKSILNVNNLKENAPLTHAGNTEHKWKCCGKSFSQAETLKKHIQTVHKGHKDHKCESCGKSFSQAGTLKKHIQTVHEGRKDYKCEFCGKTFYAAGDLKKHIHIVHKGHKDYKCKSCGKMFSRTDSLKKHIHIVHDGNKNYKCESCGKSFSQAFSLKIHSSRRPQRSQM